jgi:adenylylsulfate kinase
MRRERSHGIPFIRSCHEYLRAADLSIAAMNSIRRAITPTRRVLDVGDVGAAGLLALRYGAERVVVLVGENSPSIQPGMEQWPLDGRLVFANGERVAALAAKGELFDVILGDLSAGGSRVDLNYGSRLDDVARRFAMPNATVVPSAVRYSAQLVEWSDAARLDAEVVSRSRDLGSRYAIDFEPVLQQLTGVTSPNGSVHVDVLRTLSAPTEFLTYYPGGRSAKEFALDGSVRLTALQPGRIDAIVWIQELIHDGIVICRACECSWAATRVELDKDYTIDVPVADMLHAVPLTNGDVAQRLQNVTHGTSVAAPLVFWLTGISGAGKTTIATRFKRHADTLGWPVSLLDGDVLRGGLNADLGFSDVDRAENVRRIAEVAALMADMGRITVVSCISPKQAFRDTAREIIGAGRFVEVFVDAPAAVAEARDPKGLYQRARAGQITSFTGVHSGYEPPRYPQIHLDTTTTDVEGAVQMLCRFYDEACQSAGRIGEAETVL